jgi:uncharacterized Rmd1/YagE family protein
MPPSLPSLPFQNLPTLVAQLFICHSCRRASSFGIARRPKYRPIHASTALSYPRKRDFFTNNSALRQKHQSRPVEEEVPKIKKPRPAAKTSLRRVAVEAQRSKDGIKPTVEEQELATKTVTAYCVAEQFDLAKVAELLREKHYTPDPFKTGLYPHVIHVQVPVESIWSHKDSLPTPDIPEVGDIFIFPSGTVVTWALPEGFTSYFATRTLLPAARNEHVSKLETEDMEYVEDSQREHSIIRGDTIVLGTQSESNEETVLTKIAFSSGLARSTKLAVLETLLESYFESTKSIPTLMSRGSRLPFTRAFILRKTGQLLSVRAQLNLYSELTDSLPDLFWDSRHELGLEGYYDQVGRALDVGIRIKTLNEKMDYAQEIASVLRELLSEKHGLFLEWTIIALIAVEVGFEVLRLWKERLEKLEKAEKDAHSAQLE